MCDGVQIDRRWRLKFKEEADIRSPGIRNLDGVTNNDWALEKKTLSGKKSLGYAPYVLRKYQRRISHLYMMRLLASPRSDSWTLSSFLRSSQLKLMLSNILHS